MATELEQVLKKAKYTALPLPRAKAGPTTIYAFHDGQLYIVRNAQTCLPLPVTPDPSVDVVQFSREYKFTLGGVVGFLAKLFGTGNAKGELEVHAIKSAAIQLGGLSHETIETGALLDYLLAQKPSPCLRDLLRPENLTIVAALQAKTFTFTFKTAKGTTVKFSAEEAKGLFRGDASVAIEVSESGQIVVNAPCYVGVISWDGKTMKRELERARRAVTHQAVLPYRPSSLVGPALTSDEIHVRRLKGLEPLPLRRPRASEAGRKTRGKK